MCFRGLESESELEVDGVHDQPSQLRSSLEGNTVDVVASGSKNRGLEMWTV